ncbi:MAG: hypothetical protein PVG06_07970 [Desulfobacterales bacterium]
MPKSTTTRKAGGLDFTATGGNGGAQSAAIVENNAVKPGAQHRHAGIEKPKNHFRRAWG